LNANLAAQFDFDRWSVGWATNFYSSYRLNVDRSVDATLDRATVPSQTYHDIFVGYRFGQPRDAGSEHRRIGAGFPTNTELQLRVENAFNTQPPIGTTASPYYSPWGDPRGAYYHVSIRTAF
jgi:outer membrane receptor protein involved in Fe transport